MQRQAVPFNVSLLQLTPAKLKGLKPVRSLDIFDGAGSSSFHEDGLFSVSIFGKVGDERRSQRFSYIDLKVPVFHPVIYRALVGLKRLYAGILAGVEYAKWNPVLNDFERSNQLEGQTGYAFFCQHWDKIDFVETKSSSRDQNIKLINKYKDRAMTDKVVVMPAGLRDVEVLPDGRIQKDEINEFYSKLLAVANTVYEAAARGAQPEMLNITRWRMQRLFCELYEYLEAMIEGKKKLLMGKWAARRVQNGTRNVITAMDTSTPYLGASGAVGFNNTIMGLYQTLKGLMPVARYHLRHGFLSQVFPGPGVPVHLVNKHSWQAEEVELKSAYFDRYATDEGLEKVISAFGEESMRHKPVEIEGRYLGLIYKGPDGTFRLMRSIDELPEGRSKADVHPLTFCELLYTSTYLALNKYPVFVTRYPVTGIGSIYPSKVYVKTTIQSQVRRQLNENWEPMDDEHTAYQFPIVGAPFVNSLVPHSAKLKGLGADFDGDTSSATIVYSDESVQEVDNFLSTKRAYVGTDGRFISSTGVDTVNLVLHNLTGD